MSTPSVYFFSSLGVVPQEPYYFFYFIYVVIGFLIVIYFIIIITGGEHSARFVFCGTQSITAYISTTHFLKSSGITPGQSSGSTTGSTARKSSSFSVGVIYQIYLFCQFYSKCNILASLGVLPQILYHFCGSTCSKVVEYLWDHFQTVKKQTLGVFLP